jgi:hypothetical protein
MTRSIEEDYYKWPRLYVFGLTLIGIGGIFAASLFFLT